MGEEELQERHSGMVRRATLVLGEFHCFTTEHGGGITLKAVVLSRGA